jgi:hypothetical protein
MHPNQHRELLGCGRVLWAEDIHAQARLVLVKSDGIWILYAGEAIFGGILCTCESCWWTCMGESALANGLRRIVDAEPCINWCSKRLLGQCLIHSRADKAPIAGEVDFASGPGRGES